MAYLIDKKNVLKLIFQKPALISLPFIHECFPTLLLIMDIRDILENVQFVGHKIYHDEKLSKDGHSGAFFSTEVY